MLELYAGLAKAVGGPCKGRKKIVDTASARRYQFQNFETFLAVPRNGIKLSPRTLEQNSLGNAQGTTEKNMWILASLQLQASICWKSGALKATPHELASLQELGRCRKCKKQFAVPE